MSEPRESKHGEWSGRWAFVLAATGSAVGLGNIWKFPYIAGENGGGAFVLIYLACILVIGIPVFMGEILIGRRGRLSPDQSVRVLAEEADAPIVWQWGGFMGILAAFFILSFYVVIAGWSLSYIITTATGTFKDATPEQVGAVFDDLLASPQKIITWGTIVLVITMLTVAQGVKKGLERTISFLMPGMIIILLLLLGYSMSNGAFMEGLEFLFKPDFSKITGTGVLVALGHAFFTLSLGSGAMIAYGSYLRKDISIHKTCLIIAAADTVVALMAGLVIFPIVFKFGLDPGEGPPLIFVTLPIAFGQMPFGTIVGTLFFVMLAFAAFTSAIALLEPPVVWLMEKSNLTRARATLVMGTSIWILSLGTALSFNRIAEVYLYGEKNFFDAIDHLASNIMMPLGGLFVAVFTGWVMKTTATQDELDMGDGPSFNYWRFILRYVAPVLILLVFLNVIGVIDLSPESASVED
jgi:NSS family neurotransmitter:Na+ symporter